METSGNFKLVSSWKLQETLSRFRKLQETKFFEVSIWKPNLAFPTEFPYGNHKMNPFPVGFQYWKLKVSSWKLLET